MKKNIKYDFEVDAVCFISDVKGRIAYNGGGSHTITKFRWISDFNKFSDREIAERWIKKINAQLKLRLIAEHLNKGWEPDWENENEIKYSISFNMKKSKEIFIVHHLEYDEGKIYFKSEELAKKAREIMDDQVYDLFLKQ
jgi:hypothetical protein